MNTACIWNSLLRELGWLYTWTEITPLTVWTMDKIILKSGKNPDITSHPKDRWKKFFYILKFERPLFSLFQLYSPLPRAQNTFHGINVLMYFHSKSIYHSERTKHHSLKVLIVKYSYSFKLLLSPAKPASQEESLCQCEQFVGFFKACCGAKLTAVVT